MRRWLPLLLLLTLSVVSTQTLTLRFLDVGQGDAVLITAPGGQTLLYDGGRSEARMRELIRQYRPERLDVLVASHADADHITGLIPAVALYKPKLFVNNGLASTTQTWAKLVGVVSLAGTQGKKAAGGVIHLGSVKITVLAPPPGMPQDEQNVNSIGLLVEYGSFRALMTGDSETPETAEWLRQLSRPDQRLHPVPTPQRWCVAVHPAPAPASAEKVQMLLPVLILPVHPVQRAVVQHMRLAACLAQHGMEFLRLFQHPVHRGDNPRQGADQLPLEVLKIIHAPAP